MNFRDRGLVRKILGGDRQAFAEFFDGYFPGLYRFALTRVRYSDDAAEEVAQATLCKAMTKLSTYRGEASLFTWLCTFCRHEISAYYKRRRIDERQVDLTEDLPQVRAALESIGPVFADPDVALDRQEIARFVQVALDQLPPNYGNALEWKYLEERSVNEIADRLKLSPKAAESLLTRARAAFREAFRSLIDASPMESS